MDIEGAYFKPPFMTESQYTVWAESGAHMIGLMKSKRLTFPFSTSPHLSYFTGSLIIYGLFQLYIRENIIWYYLVISLLIILVGSFSRSGFLALVISLMIAYTYQKNNKNQFNTKPILLIFITVIVVLPLSFVTISQVLDLQPLIRLAKFDLLSADSSFVGHLSIRVRIIKEIFSSNPINMFFGYGIGGTQKYLNVSSGHMSFATVLYDMGLVGFFFFSLLWVYPIIKMILKYGAYKKSMKAFYFALNIFLVLCHMFYNATTFVPLWFYLGWIVNYVNTPQKARLI